MNLLVLSYPGGLPSLWISLGKSICGGFAFWLHVSAVAVAFWSSYWWVAVMMNSVCVLGRLLSMSFWGWFCRLSASLCGVLWMCWCVQLVVWSGLCKFSVGLSVGGVLTYSKAT